MNISGVITREERTSADEQTKRNKKKNKYAVRKMKAGREKKIEIKTTGEVITRDRATNTDKIYKEKKQKIKTQEDKQKPKEKKEKARVD